MDLSKLPRLSETDKHAPPTPSPEEQLREQHQQQQRPSAAPLDYQATAPPSSTGGQIWLSAFLGVVFMLVGRTFARYLIAKMTGQQFHTGVNWVAGPKAGQEAEYFELEGYTALTDACMFFFGLAMVLEAAVLAFVVRNTRPSRALLTIALLVTVGMTLLNLIVVGLIMSNNGGLPLPSLLVVGFGGYMAWYEWQMLQPMLHAARQHSRA